MVQLVKHLINKIPPMVVVTPPKSYTVICKNCEATISYTYLNVIQYPGAWSKIRRSSKQGVMCPCCTTMNEHLTTAYNSAG